MRVAEAEMLGALRVMTVERGIDPRGFALMPFGGAGPLHAAALARELGISRILCPRASGVLCALGLAAAAPRRDVARTLMLRRRVALARAPVAASARADRRSRRRRSRATPARVRVRHELRYRGQSFELPVDEEIERPRAARGAPSALDPDALRAAFARAHEQRYGYRDDGGRGRARQHARVGLGRRSRAAAPGARARASTPRRPTRDRSSSTASPLATSVLRGEPAPGARVSGPALCALPEATLLVPPGWSGEVDEQGTVDGSVAGT